MTHLARRPFASSIVLSTLALQVACGGAQRSAYAPSPTYGGSGGTAYASESAPADAPMGARPAEPSSAPAYGDSSGSYAKSESKVGSGADYSAPPPVAKAPPAAPKTTTAPAPKAAGAAGKAAEASVAASAKDKKAAPPMLAPTPTKPVPGMAATTPAITGTGTIVIGGGTPHPGGGTVQEVPQGGILTAAIWDDNAMRASFLTFVDRYPAFGAQWGLDLKHRVTIRVEDSSGVAVGDAPLSLRAPDGSIVNLRTHGDGTALFYPKSAYAISSQGPNGQGTAATFSVAAQVGALRTESSFGAPAADATWTIKLAGVPARAKEPALDIAFVVDTTGSMGDEIAYLQSELMGVVKTVKSQHAMRRVRLGLVLYKDRGDEYVTKTYPFTEDLNTYLNQLKTAEASGGGDMPESVNAALSETVSKLAWAGDETGRLAILVADAPPHYYADETYTYKNAIVDLAARGIKLTTVGASGIDKTTEYVFRQMSAFTGGRYVFLTDDSGVGDSHITPDISGYQVEHLNKILVRVIGDEAKSFKR